MEDLSTLFLTIHGAIQIFRPTINVHDPRNGLGRFRPATNIIMFFMPIISGSLAYINRSYAYIAQGAFCIMAVRPLWYRLALQWVPRYFVFVIVIILCTVVYAYVGKQLRSFDTTWAVGEIDLARRPSGSILAPVQLVVFNYESNTERQASPPTTDNPLQRPNIMRSPSDVESLAARPKAKLSQSDHKMSTATMSTNDTEKSAASSPCPIAQTFRLNLTSKSTDFIPPPEILLSPLKKLRKPTLSAATPQEVLTSQRHEIILQLRMIFLYPIIYIALWIFPFVFHVCNIWISTPRKCLSGSPSWD